MSDTATRLRENAMQLRHAGVQTLALAEDLFDEARKLKAQARAMERRAEEIDELDDVRALSGDPLVMIAVRSDDGPQ